MPRISISIGVGPENATKFDDDIELLMREIIPNKNVRAIGSCGITQAGSAAEIQAFRRQIALAGEAGLPLEETDVEIVPMIPRRLDTLSTEAFYQALEALERSRRTAPRPENRWERTYSSDPAPSEGESMILTGTFSFAEALPADGMAVYDPKAGTVTFNMPAAKAQVIAETLTAVTFICRAIARNGYTLSTMGEAAKAFIANWESEKYRKSLAGK